MDVLRREVRIYENAFGEVPFSDWLHAQRDIRARNAIRSRLVRLMFGNLGDYKFIGEGVCELRIHLSPGYRIYVGLHGSEALVLLGGTKDTQSADIPRAIFYWKEHFANEK